MFYYFVIQFYSIINSHLATEVKCEFSAMSDFDNSTICALITICIDLNGTRPDLFKVSLFFLMEGLVVIPPEQLKY